MDWLFVIGISLEISGATLIAGEVLFASNIDVFARGKSFWDSSPSDEPQRGAAFTYAGFVLLAIGFALQLIGYVIDAHDKWFILVAVLTIVAATLIGAWLALHPVRRWLVAKGDRGMQELGLHSLQQEQGVERRNEKESTVEREPRWEVPPEYGYAGAIEGMGSIAAPLLAGISFALAVFLIQSKEGSSWTSAALLLLVGAALAFIAAVQFTFRARQFSVTPPEIEMWWAHPADPGRREMLRREQRHYLAIHRVWAKLPGWAYEIGLLSFVLGVTASLAPAGGLEDASAGRLAVMALALLGFVVEVVWIAWDTFARTNRVSDWPPAPGPETDY